MKKSVKINNHKVYVNTEYTSDQINKRVHVNKHVNSHEHVQSDEYDHIHSQNLSDDHDHSHSHGGGHKHTHKNTKVVLDRLSRASGHLESVKRMIADGKDCSEVLIQLSAVIAALNNTGKVILKDHIENCIVEAVENGDKDALDNLNSAIDRFIK